MAYVTTIAESVVAVLANLGGAPDLVEFRKTDVLHPREADELVESDEAGAIIVTAGDVVPFMDLTGGDVLRKYQIGVSIYKRLGGKFSSEKTVNPDLVLACKQALHRTSLAGASTVFDTDLVESPEWENQAFKDGWEVSRFGVIFNSAEPRNG
jgi:hypothetical protein